ncbi:MAG TPA: substrate-binding domain-containing protein [Anaerolineae bacterium]|nr:substrate-binding domain-containing protein [Anaerolineae bacterium]HQI86886.1 substrate-binding domain-containing protein [Anaerolineae bacterium]
MRRWLSVLLPLLCFVTGCTGAVALVPTPTPLPAPLTPQIIQVACPENLAPLVMALASAYQREEAGVQIVVVERADTLAYQALVNGDVDIAALAWLPTVISGDVWRVPFARDGLAIVVNTRNGLPGLTLDQLRQLFRGRVEDWEPWGGLPGAPQIISREEASGDYNFFQAQVMRDARVALTALLAPTSAAACDVVSRDPLAVGYLSTAWLDGDVRALTIEGVPPANEAVAAGLYPLSRDLFLATVGEPQGMARPFIQWVLSSQGQNIVAAQRFTPLPQ